MILRPSCSSNCWRATFATLPLFLPRRWQRTPLIDDRSFLLWKDVLKTGIHVFIAGFKGASSLAPSSGGGGTSNDMPWRDKDEDLRDYARRVMRYAHAKCYSTNRHKRRRADSPRTHTYIIMSWSFQNGKTSLAFDRPFVRRYSIFSKLVGHKVFLVFLIRLSCSELPNNSLLIESCINIALMCSIIKSKRLYPLL